MQRKGLFDGDGNPQQGELLLQVVIARALRKQLIHLPGFLQGLLEPAEKQPGLGGGGGTRSGNTGRERVTEDETSRSRQEPLTSAPGTSAALLGPAVSPSPPSPRVMPHAAPGRRGGPGEGRGGESPLLLPGLPVLNDSVDEGIDLLDPLHVRLNHLHARHLHHRAQGHQEMRAGPGGAGTAGREAEPPPRHRDFPPEAAAAAPRGGL